MTTPVPIALRPTRGGSAGDADGPTIVVLDDPDAVAAEGARRVRAAVVGAVAARGACVLALAGGATPKKLYARLALEPAHPARSGGDGFDWTRVQLFFGDERCVPPGHPDSNFGMVKAALLDQIDIPAANVHRLRGEESDAAVAADAYARELHRPLDLALLGMGPDGHTASLFPNTSVLDDNSRACAAVAAVPGLRTGRLTLTLPVFLEARQILFVVTGADKAQVLRDVVRGPFRPRDLPAQIIARRAQPVTILCDRAAAGAGGFPVSG